MNGAIALLCGNNHHYLSCPQSAITTFFLDFPDSEPTLSIFITVSIPFVTLPKTTCLPSSQLVTSVQRKNWEPLVFGPAFLFGREDMMRFS
jgi:hypothetical protein